VTSAWSLLDDCHAPLRRYRAAVIAKRVHAHGLRHTHASELRSEGISLNSRQFGHADIATTARYLDHINPQAVIQTVGKWWMASCSHLAPDERHYSVHAVKAERAKGMSRLPPGAKSRDRNLGGCLLGIRAEQRRH